LKIDWNNNKFNIMEFNKQNIQSKVSAAETHVIDEGLRAYML